MLPLALHSVILHQLSSGISSVANHESGSLFPDSNTEGEPFQDLIASTAAPSENMSTIQGPFFHKHVTIRVVVGITCFLSMLGALLIILSYMCIKEIRTKSRQILVHLSAADFGVASANFIGVCVYFDQYIRHCPLESHTGQHSTSALDKDTISNGVNTHTSCGTLLQLCKTQAFIAAYSTLASVLWTLCLAVYIYCLVFYTSKRVHLRVVCIAIVFCWGMPLFVSLWLVITDQLGYSPEGGSGWCTLKVHTDNGGRNVFAIIFGNDLWIYLTFITVTILYLSVHCHIKLQLKEVDPILLQGSSMATINKADTKFLLIPFFYLLLRIWTMILVFLVVYLQVEPPISLSYILLYAAGIGDSAQGLVNALLFCVFTPKVREKLLSCCMSRVLQKCCIPPKQTTTSAADLQLSNSSSLPIMGRARNRATSDSINNCGEGSG